MLCFDMKNFNDSKELSAFISKQTVFKNNKIQVWLEKHRLEDNKTHVFTTVQARDWVLIIPQNKEKFVFVNQYRPSWQMYSLEFPAGKIDSNETPEECALRELEEETGYKTKKIVKIAVFRPVTWTTQTAYIFYATNLEKGEKITSDEAEFTEVIQLRQKELEEGIKRGEIFEGPTLAAWGIFLLKRKDLLFIP